MLACGDKSCAPVNFSERLVGKDGIARVIDGRIIEISVNIFGDDCHNCRPFYKFQKAAASAWMGKVVQFISEGKDQCYAENALNEILEALKVIEEIVAFDNKE